MQVVKEKAGWGRWAFPAWFLVMFFVTNGFSRRSIASALVLAIAAGALLMIEVRSQRPRRSFYRLALVCSLFLIVLMDVSWQGRWILALVTWFVMSGSALAYTVYYERAEALG